MSAIDVEISTEGVDIELSSNSSPKNEESDERKISLSSVGSAVSNKSKSKVNLISKFQRRSTSSSSNNSNSNLIARRWRSVRHAVKVSNAVSMSRKKSPVAREDSFLKKFSTRNQYRSDSDASIEDAKSETTIKKDESAEKITFVIRPDGNFMFYWLGVLTIAVLYNLWTCIARQAFYEIHQGHVLIWIAFDILCDTVYILDIVVQFRTGYLDQGLMVYDSGKLAQKYLKSKYLYIDIACLIPLDFIQFQIGVHPMIRFPRFIKVYRTFRFVHMLESRTAYPNFVRVANLTHILFLGSHWFAAFYYMISEAENFHGDWSYPKPEGEFRSVTRKYLASLFWSTLTLTTIGDLPPPETNWEYVFVIVSYLIGVFIFATIVGQVGNVINNRNASRQEFERLLDGAKLYMQMHNVPNELQKRVQRWYDYVWTRGRMKGSDINSLGLLPDKLKTELAIHVNLETLKKVTIFQECQPEFLHDLVLKMRAYIFTPGDLICRRGEIAREMFIIADGVVEIISESGTILTQMSTGDFFGEIGILNLDGGINRRTADVRSVGYSELFVLSREDVLGALKDHPEAEGILVLYGTKRLNDSRKNSSDSPDLNSHDLRNHNTKRLYNRLLREEKLRSIGNSSNGLVDRSLSSPFTLYRQFSDIKEEPSPRSNSPYVAEDQTCATSNESVDRSCCCSQVQEQIRDIEIQLGALERMYYESIKQLKEITTQQNVLLQCVQKTQHSVIRHNGLMESNDRPKERKRSCHPPKHLVIRAKQDNYDVSRAQQSDYSVRVTKQTDFSVNRAKQSDYSDKNDEALTPLLTTEL